jgi:hypothetical protein
VKGVTVDDKKLGTGPAAKKGDRVSMRYIGKLTDGKVFDCMDSSDPFIIFVNISNLLNCSEQEGQAIQLQAWLRRGHPGLGYWCCRHVSRR